MEVAAGQALTRFASIDDLLGDSRTRFFGAGFRQVKDKIVRVDVSPRERAARASAQLEYPSKWSTKKEGELQAHLSTLDGLMIAAQMAECYLRVSHELSEASARRMFLSRVVLKSGATPTLDLNDIPVQLRATAPERSVLATCGYVTALSVQVGTMSVELSIDHEAPVQSEWPVHRDNIEEIVGPREYTYYGGAYRKEVVTVRDLEFAPGSDWVRARMDLESPYDADDFRGMSAKYGPFVSPASLITCAAQLSQALMYRYDGITRDVSHNLWMRKVVMHAEVPAKAGYGLKAEVRATKMSLLTLKDTTWRVGSFLGKVPGIVVEHNLAHQLPDSRVETSA